MFGFDAEEEKALSPTTTVEIELLHTSSWKNAKDASTTLCSTTLRAKLAVDNTKKSFKKNLNVDGMHSSNLAVANVEFNIPRVDLNASRNPVLLKELSPPQQKLSG